MTTADRSSFRATFDPAVVDAWRQALIDHPPPLRRTSWAVTGAGLLCGAAGLAFNQGWLLTAGFVLIAGATALFFTAAWRNRRHLRCPHCGRSPVTEHGRESLRGALWCKHCLYWLQPPY